VSQTFSKKVHTGSANRLNISIMYSSFNNDNLGFFGIILNVSQSRSVFHLTISVIRTMFESFWL